MLTTDQLIGSGLAILSAFMHAADGVMVKHITTLTAMEISFWRLTGQTIIMVPICHYRYHKRLPNSDIFNQIPLLLLYAAVCCTTVVTGFRSFVLLPIGDAVAIAATAVDMDLYHGFHFLERKTSLG